MPWYQAPAKINLGLWVGSPAENGYHPVDTVMQTVGIADQLYLEPQNHLAWETTPGAPPMDDRNLVVRAYHWCKRRLPNLPAVYGRLEKVTWVGAGLGGGSSDAAALIRWAYEGLPHLRSAAFLSETADLGMDVPFFIRGGAARAQGFGEAVTPLPSLKADGVVLANPGMALSTHAVYAAFDDLPDGAVSSVRGVDAVAQALAEGVMPAPGDLVNALEAAAFLVFPGLRDFRAAIEEASDGAPLALSGSGPTYYILGSDVDWASWMARRLMDRGLSRVVATSVSESW